MKALNLLQERFGKGIVTKFIGHRTKGQARSRSVRVWGLICDCGKEYESSTELLKSGDCSSCGCQRQNFHKNSSSPTTLPRYLKHLRQDAKRRGREFNLNQEELSSLLEAQERKCALSGLPISFEDSSASLDRIQNDLGYSISNVQWVHRKVNYMKNTLEEGEFIRICGLVATRRQTSS